MLLRLHRAWPCCEPFRRLVSLSVATSLNVTPWAVSETADQSIKRTFCEERNKVTFFTLSYATNAHFVQLTAFITPQPSCDISIKVWWQCWVPVSSVVIALFLLPSGLCSEHRDKGENENERFRSSLPPQYKPRDSSPGKQWLWQGQVNCDYRSRIFQRLWA